MQSVCLIQVSAIENLEIPAFIGDKVRMAQHQAQDAITEARNRGSYLRAMLAAREARINAEVAQSHHSIATHHSYPAQHKVALYLPLFAPLSLPLLVTLVREVMRKLRASKQA
jgi:GPI-anchor transamidase subunit S